MLIGYGLTPKLIMNVKIVIDNAPSDLANIVALIEYTAANEPCYTVHARTESLANQLLELISRPYKIPFTVYDGDLSIWTRRPVYPGEERHFLMLGGVRDTREMFDKLGLTVIGHLNDSLPILPIRLERRFPRPTPR